MIVSWIVLPFSRLQCLFASFFVASAMIRSIILNSSREEHVICAFFIIEECFHSHSLFRLCLDKVCFYLHPLRVRGNGI